MPDRSAYDEMEDAVELLLERERFLAEAGVLLASSLDYQATLARVAHLAVPRVADYCIIDVLEEDGRLHRRGAAHVAGREERLLAGAGAYPPAPGTGSPALRVLETQEPVLVRQVTEEWMAAVAQTPEHLEFMRRLDPRSAIIVPLAARGRALGILWLVASESDRSYGSDDVLLAQELGRRAGVAVDNAALYRSAREAQGHAERRAREEEALREAIATVSASASTEEVIRQIAVSAITATNADAAFVERIEIDPKEVQVVASAGEIAPAIGSRGPYAGSFTEHVVEHEDATAIDRLGDAGDRLAHDLTESHPEHAALVLPLLDGGEPLGTLILLRSPAKRDFRPDEVERAGTFAELAALAFHKINMLEESEQRREELQRVMESRTRLMRGFSHDVKNPLGAADGFLGLLEDGVLGELPEPQRQKVTQARRSVGVALSLIEDLLEIARVESGQLEVDRAPVDVREVVRELGEEYRLQAESKGLTLELELPAELPVIASDPRRVRQILGNLLSNAVKYTDAGGIEVSVEVRGGETPGDGAGGETPGDGAGEAARIATEVRDTGPGIPKEKQRLLFQEFARVDPTGKGGAGIGLAISQNLAHALGGEITVSSQAGEGSTFTFWLPT